MLFVGFVPPLLPVNPVVTAQAEPTNGVQSNAPEAREQKKETRRGLTITYDEQWTSLAERRQVFRGKVRAEYDVTVLEAEELEIDEAKKIGWARGGVRVVDPEGEIVVQELTFRWREQSDLPFGPEEEVASGTNARIRAGNVLLEAKKIQIIGQRWVLTDSWGSLTQRDRPEWKIRARRVSLTPGVSGRAEHIHLEALGLRIGPLPSYSFTLNPRIQSKFVLPTYSRDENGRYGLAWSFVRPLNENSALKGSWSSFPKKATSWNLTYTFSPLSTTATSALISVPSDLSERFDDGWLDNIQVISPLKEEEDYRQKRMNWQFQTDWNSGASLRPEAPEAIVRLADIANEQGGPRGSLGTRLVSRLQVVRSRPEQEFRPRGVFQATAHGPEWNLGSGLTSRLRLDAFGTLSPDAAYGWLRGQAAILYQPVPQARLGLGYVFGQEAGAPDFEYDRLFSSRAIHFRADFQSGPWTARWLGKYDFDFGLIYDREYEVAFVAGAFEPFIQYRQQPGSYQFGIRFRMDNVAQRLVSRSQKRDIGRPPR